MIFFVISGMLITTLLLREESEHGRICLRGFYLRRICRILPLYYLALLIFSLAVAAGLGEHPGDYADRLVHFVTFTNEYASPGTFGHSWSLGIEEKFYLTWPLIGFIVPVLCRRRASVLAVMCLMTTTVGLVHPSEPLSFYSPVLVGCLLGLALHNEQTFRLVRRAALPGLAISLATCAGIFVLLLSTPGRTSVDVIFGISAAVALPGLLLGPSWLSGWLRASPMLFVGRRSYAIYLFHPLVGSLLALGMSRTDGLWPAAYLTIMFLATLALADVLYRIVERPMIRFGHRVTKTAMFDPELQGIGS